MRVALLAAGRGERLYPITENIPKPLVLVAGKPFIVHTLSNLQRLGLNKIIIVTGKNTLTFRKTLEKIASEKPKCFLDALLKLDDAKKRILITLIKTPYHVEYKKILHALWEFKNIERYKIVVNDYLNEKQ